MATIEKTINFQLSEETMKRIERVNDAAKELSEALEGLKSKDY